MNKTNIRNISKLQFKNWSAGEKYQGKTAEIAREMGAVKLGFHVEILLPAMFSCPYHFHDGEEELFFVLEGKAVLRQNNRYREVIAGDIIHFKCRKEDAHQFYNHTRQDFKFFALSNRDDNDIVDYPDSGKFYVRKHRKMFRQKDTVAYLTDEEHPEKYWDGRYLKSDSV